MDRGSRTRAAAGGGGGAVSVPGASSRPLVAIVGRPNVGKSTLFNRLVGARRAIVEDRPGVTRDRHYAETAVHGRPVLLVDTGGFDPASDDPMTASIATQVRLAVDECDVVICVLDATSPPLEADARAVDMLRRSGKPVLYVANKADGPSRVHEAADLHRLGVERILPVSALHGHGMAELERAIVAALPSADAERRVDPADDVPRVAIVGRPNAGKSSLVNRLLGEDRQLVDARPGTTIDAIDAWLERDGRRWILTDTAGIRRRRSVETRLEAAAVLAALRAIDRSDAVVLLVDATLGATEQDARIAGIVEERGRAMLIALNKADRLDAEGRRAAARQCEDTLGFVSWAPRLFVSALTGRGTGKLLDTVDRIVRSHRHRVGTAELNRFFHDVVERHPPPTRSGRAARLYYVAQTATRPPTFSVVASDPSLVGRSYARYLVNQLRVRFELHGTPIRVRFRPRRRREQA
ncbi:MAG: ribosome biogenesis GTPase Der [Myxococcota bacterium]|nr:ribosome biogenesis GTPase Der [Myxococcota bacterium]MDW8362451.1 ribosome biogenesis GTPase Der [Myxococcales bacterium]